MKIKTFKNCASVIQDDPSFPSGMTRVIAYDSAGNVIDKIRCDTRREANEYFRAFCAIAKKNAPCGGLNHEKRSN